jgi:ABC-type multidrug transport system ATPase subunit
MNELLDQIYKHRNDFILIGLTGKIGSGCTTVANILSSTVKGTLNIVLTSEPDLEVSRYPASEVIGVFDLVEV